jgi:hypothetical protein
VNQKIVLALGLMLALAVALSYAASKYPVLPLDLQSYQELQEEANPLFNILMQGVSYLGEIQVAMALVAITAAIFALRRQWLEAIFILATTSSVLLAFALKEIIHRARPFPAAENATGARTYDQTNTAIQVDMSYSSSYSLDLLPILLG